MQRKKVVRALLWLVAVIVLLHIHYVALSIIAYGQHDEKTRADAAIVLGASVDGTTPSPVFRARIDHGIWLYQNGYVHALILTGGVGEGNVTSDAAIAREYAMHAGVPKAAIWIEESSTITQENLQNAAAIVRENGWHKVILVSDPLHMRRAMLMAEDYGLDAYSSPTPTSRYQTVKTQLPFLAREVFFYLGYEVYRIFAS